MKLKSNIAKLYATHFLNGVVFFYGVEKIFYESIGIDEVGIGVVTVAYLLTALLLDIPSGVLADKWSRKNVLIVSSVMLIISSIVLGLSQGLAQYSIGAILWGGYYILTSGTYEALTYDSLHELKRTKEFSKVLGREQALFLFGLVFSSAASGYIAEFTSLATTYFLSVIPAIINIVIFWSIKEPTFHKDIADHKLIDHLKTVVRYLSSTTMMRRLSIVLIAMILLETHTDEYGQVVFIELGFSVAVIGILGAIYAGAGALGQLLAYRMQKIRPLLFPAIGAFLMVFAFTHSRWALVAFFLVMLLRAILENLTETDIQDSIDSSVRATTLSVLGFAANLISIPLIMAFGYIAREFDVFMAFRVMASVYAVLAVVVLLSRLATSRRSVSI